MNSTSRRVLMDYGHDIITCFQSWALLFLAQRLSHVDDKLINLACFGFVALNSHSPTPNAQMRTQQGLLRFIPSEIVVRFTGEFACLLLFGFLGAHFDANSDYIWHFGEFRCDGCESTRTLEWNEKFRSNLADEFEHFLRRLANV